MEPLDVFLPVLVPFTGALPLAFLSGEGGAESFDPAGRTTRAVRQKIQDGVC